MNHDLHIMQHFRSMLLLNMNFILFKCRLNFLNIKDIKTHHNIVYKRLILKTKTTNNGLHKLIFGNRFSSSNKLINKIPHLHEIIFNTHITFLHRLEIQSNMHGIMHEFCLKQHFKINSKITCKSRKYYMTEHGFINRR